MTSPPAPRPRRRLRLLTATAAIVAALLLCELLVRLLWEPPPGGYPPDLFISDPHTQYRLRPGIDTRHRTEHFDIEIRVDARGYRSAPSTAAVADGLRVAALGDSFCFGSGVEAGEAYPALLAAELAARGGRSVEVINCGAPGYGTHNAAALLEADRAALDADAVVLGLYLGNDFRDNHTEEFGTLTARSGVLVTVDRDNPAWWLTLKAAVVIHSHAVQLLMRGLGGAPLADEQELERRFCAALDWDPAFSAAMFDRTWSPRAEAAFAATTAQLERLASACREAELPLLVVLLPGPYQYHPALWKIVVDRCGLDAATFDLDKANQALRSWGDRHGVAMLDLTPAFRRATAAQQHLYLDVHFNAAGHRLAAREIAAAWERLRIPGPG